MPRTQSKLSFKQLRVGLFLIVALLILGFLILNSSGDFNPFEKKLRLKARFITGDGLHPNAEVHLAGISIGKVEEVKFLLPESGLEERIEAQFAVTQELEGRPINEL